MFVILSCSFLCFKVYSSDLNYLKLNGLRDQHVINNHVGGSTQIYINTSKRFLDLLDSLETDEVSTINKSVEDAYNNPYKTQVTVSQAFLIKDILFEISAQDSLVAEINNPVFPEIELFNVRADILSIQKNYKINDYSFTPKLSVMNRWYINKIFSLEEIITDNVDMDLKNGETLVPLYFDFQGIYKKNEYIFYFDGRGFELTTVDKFDYYELETSILKKIYYSSSLGFSFTPLYRGSYSIQDSSSLIIKYNNYDHVMTNIKFSNLSKEVKASVVWKNLLLSVGIENIKKSYLSEVAIHNFTIQLSSNY